MSVLLDALKKAAENKKQSDVSTESLEVDENSVADREATQVSDVRQLEKVGDEDSSEAELEIRSPQIKLSTEEEPSVSEKTLSIDELDIVENIDTKNHDEVSSDEVSSIMPETTPTLLVTTTVEAETVSEQEISFKTNETKDVVTAENESSGATNETLTDRLQKESEDSFDWSLNKLPGYSEVESLDLQQSAPEPIGKEPFSDNQILTTNKRFLRTGQPGTIRQFIFGGSSNIAIYLLFSVFTMTVIGFFSIYYFQQQSELLDHDMHKYKLVRTELPTTTSLASMPEEGVVNDLPEDHGVEKGGLTLSETVFDTTISKPEGTAFNHQQPLQSEQPKQEVSSKAQVRQVKQNPLPVNKPSVLTITASNQESNIQLAYSALYANDLKQARELFEKILKSDSDNVNALNGLASVYAQTNNESEAVKVYKQVLSISPTNLHAFEALVSLLGSSITGSEWKQEVIQVLEMNPNSSVLNYAAGNMFAAEGDWKTAQDYFFNASVLEQGNPDYLVNLAVSLDRLGQYELAEQNYTSALVYSQSKQVSFDERQIKKRLITIRQFIGKNSE